MPTVKLVRTIKAHHSENGVNGQTVYKHHHMERVVGLEGGVPSRGDMVDNVKVIGANYRTDPSKMTSVLLEMAACPTEDWADVKREMETRGWSER